jgi:MinD-like ATPase involved in chromosome partitioning or flagellar assembly
MKLLIVDASNESQAFCARRVESFSRSDMEMLDLKVKLVNEQEFSERVVEADVLVIGSGVGERAIALARQAHALAPWVQIVMFVSDSAYGGGAFRSAHAVGVRKVFPDSASPLDFLQELVAIHSDFRKDGRTHEGLVVAVVQAKGGVGATSATAALAEVCSVYNRRTMLWDLDVETRDLSRSLTVSGAEAKVVSGWVNGSREITRESMRDALVPISSEVSVLMAPDKFAESLDLTCHADGISIGQRIIELARVLFDVILIDTGGRVGPASGAIIRGADVILLVLDDTILGLTAVDRYLAFIKGLIGSSDRLCFLVNPCSGALMTVQQAAAELEPTHHLGDKPWRLPALPFEARAALWPGSGQTLYSMGSKSMRQAFDKIARELGLVGAQDVAGEGLNHSGGASDETGDRSQRSRSGTSGWLARMFGKKQEISTR